MRIFLRLMIAGSLTFCGAILWGEARSQNVQDVMHGIPLHVAMITGVILLLFSICCLKRFSKLAICGIAVALCTLLACMLPTV
jgi:hypothetical protein